MKRWWYSLFPPPEDDLEAQMRANAIGAFWGLLTLGVLVIAGAVWLVAA